MRFERRGTIAVSLNGSGRLKASLRRIANRAGEEKAPELLRRYNLQWANSGEASARILARTTLITQGLSMRPGQNKRMRGRNNRKGPNPLTRTYESNGPDVKIRGTAQHIAEKYLQLARDAQSSGDTVVAENLLQHAEHYFRIIAAAQTAQQQAQMGYGRNGEDLDDLDDDDDFVALPDRFSSPLERQPPIPAPHQAQPNIAPVGMAGQPQPYFDRPVYGSEMAERTPERGERQERSNERSNERSGERHSNQHGERQERQERQPRNDRRFNQQGQGRQNFRDQQPRFETAPPAAQEQPRVNFDAVTPGLPAFITAPTRVAPAPAAAAPNAASAPEPETDGFGAQPTVNDQTAEFNAPQGDADAEARFHLRPRRRRRTRAETAEEQDASSPVAEANSADAE
jgi:hypothetical protein